MYSRCHILITEPIVNTAGSDDIPIWVPIIISVLALVGTIVQALIAFKANSDAKQREHENRKISIHDHFWIREVIVPKCVTPSLDELHELRIDNRDFSSNESIYTEKILPHFNTIRDNFLLATSALPTLGKALNELMDAMDDQINDNYLSGECDPIININDICNELSTQIINAIRDEQNNND